MRLKACDSLSGISIAGEQTKDAGSDYPYGIASFTIHCAEPAMTADIDQEFYGVGTIAVNAPNTGL